MRKRKQNHSSIEDIQQIWLNKINIEELLFSNKQNRKVSCEIYYFLSSHKK